jgi:hypothetical protein
MSLFIRPSRLLGVRASRRGLRWSAGPRWLRFHAGGGGGAGISAGAGPVTWYGPLGRRRRRRGRQR